MHVLVLQGRELQLFGFFEFEDSSGDSPSYRTVACLNCNTFAWGWPVAGPLARCPPGARRRPLTGPSRARRPVGARCPDGVSYVRY